jgi:cation:H+ antiporter
MTTTLLPWLKLAACAALIGLAGPVLTHYGDIIARLTGLSRTWIGLTLLATATSLPELFTGISAVTVAAAPNIAVGDVLGSCIFNLMMLVVLDALSRDEPVYRRIDQGHILTAGFGDPDRIGRRAIADQRQRFPFAGLSYQCLYALHHRPVLGRNACGIRL